MPSSVVMAVLMTATTEGVAAMSTQALLTTFFKKLMISLVLSGLGRALASSAGGGAMSNAMNLTQNVKSPIAPRRVIYGQRRVGGVVVFMQAMDADGKDKNLHLVFALAGHECEEIGSVWFNDVDIGTLDASGFVQSGSAFAKITQDLGTYFGTVPASPYQVTLAHAPLQIYSVSVQDVGADTYMAASYTVAGSVITFTAADAGKSYQVQYEYALSTDAYARIKKYLGTAGQAADTDLISESAGKWTTNHKLSGTAYIYARLQSNREIYPNGIPNITAIVKGKKIYDPRTTLTAWSRNPALILADYLCDTRYGMGCTYSTEIDETALIAAANICDEAIPLAAGGTEPRYTCDTVIDTSTKPQDVIQAILGSMAGSAVFIGGRWRIQAGAYVTPTITLTESDLRGSVRVQSRVSRHENFNAVKGTFVSPSDNWQATDFPAVISATFATEDNGETVYKDVDLSCTTSGTMAQRIAKIDLLRARQQISVGLPCKLTAYRLQPGDTVMLSLTRMGWSSKVFEVIASTFSPESDGTLGVDLSLRETTSSAYSWSTSEESAVDTAPDTNWPDPTNVAAPPSVTLTDVSTSGAGAVRCDLVVAWTASKSAFVATYEAQVRMINSTTWSGGEVDAKTLKWTYQGAITGATYVARVRAINTLGVPSAWTVATANTVTGNSIEAAIPGISANVLLNAGLRYTVTPWGTYPGSAAQCSGWSTDHIDGSHPNAPTPFGGIAFYGSTGAAFTGFASGTAPNTSTIGSVLTSIPVIGGKRYEVQVRHKSFLGRSRLWVFAYNASGVEILSQAPTGGTTDSVNRSTVTFSNAISDYELLWGFFNAPSTAVQCKIVLLHERPSTTGTTYFFSAMPYLAQASTPQVLPSAWSEGEGSVGTGQIADGAATGVNIATNATGTTSATTGSYVTLQSGSITNADIVARQCIVTATVSYVVARSGTAQLQFAIGDGTTDNLCSEVREATETTLYGTTTFSWTFSVAAGATLAYLSRVKQTNITGTSTFNNLSLRAELIKK